MAKFTLDTNISVDALRQPEELASLKNFLQHALPATYLSAVVLHELLVGTSSARQADLLENAFVTPFDARGRLFAPSAGAWRAATPLIASVSRGRGSPRSSLVNDVLIAASCRENGITLITRDRDFDRLARADPRVAGHDAVSAFHTFVICLVPHAIAGDDFFLSVDPAGEEHCPSQASARFSSA